jgi:putative transposase
MSAPDRRAMVERPGVDLSVRRQCALLNLARSGVYRPKPVIGAGDLALMRRIDELHLQLPFYGSRRMTFELNKEDRGVNRKRVQLRAKETSPALMRVMGIEALVPRPGTSKPAPGHKIYPYLLRGLAIAEPNHVWAADITYIPMARGFLYLVAIIDWVSRAVLAWRLSNTIDSRFCVEALQEALERYGKPKIFNTDQGALPGLDPGITSAAFTDKLEKPGVAISMDGRGRFMDNIFIERLWRSIKYEEVHLKAYADGREARAGIGSWMTFYNFRRPHQAMNNQTPMAVWRDGMDKIEAAARAVDMPLRLDNANALPTYPQHNQHEAA